MTNRKDPHVWTDDEKIVLRLLNDQFQHKPEASVRVLVFNKIFEDEHRAAGHPDGRKYSSLRSSWWDQNRRPQAWAEAINGPQPGQKQRWEGLRTRIVDALTALGKDDDAATVPPLPQPRTLQVSDTPVAAQHDVYWQDSLYCDGCNCNITLKGVDSYTCAFCKDVDYCSDCFNDREVKKCHAKGLVRQDAVEQDTPVHRTPPPSIQGAGASQDGMAMDIDPTGPTPSSAIHTIRLLHKRQFHEQPDPGYTETPLEMIHYSQVVWNGQQAYWHPAKNGQITISQASPVYRAGGKVHRVIIGNAKNGQSMDMMICNPINCRTCTDNEIDPHAIPSSDATPFVHTADTMHFPSGLVFEPIQNPRYYHRQHGSFTTSTLKNVVYGDGKIRVTEVCMVRKCSCYNDALLRGHWEDQRE